MTDENNDDFKVVRKFSISPRIVTRCLLFGVATTFVFVEVQKYWGTAAVWGALGAVSGLAVPIIWDALKKFKDEEKQFQNEVDARFDKLEQRLPLFMTHSELDTMRADIGIARADCDRALKICQLASEMARDNQDRINDIISSGVIFQLTQDLTGIKIKMAILQRLVRDKQINMSAKEFFNEIE